VAQTSPDSYKTTFKYYTLDPATGNLADAGTSSMTTTIAPDGTGTNMMIGEGEVVMDDAGDPKWEQHQFSEILALASPDTLQGSGIGTVVVSKSAEEEGGQKGKIVKYASTWEVNDSQWKITQQFQVKFKAFVFRKTYTITMNHEVRKGSDIMDLFKDADGKVNLENSAK
jgi:hypothetical protein